VPQRTNRRGALRKTAARVKRCGKSAPRWRQRRRHGKPHREQDRIGTARGFSAQAREPQAMSRAAVRVGCWRRRATGVQEEWPSRMPGLSHNKACLHAIQNPAYRLTDAKLRAPGGIPVGRPPNFRVMASGQVCGQVFLGTWRFPCDLQAGTAIECKGDQSTARCEFALPGLPMNDFPLEAGALAKSFQNATAILPAKGENSICYPMLRMPA
jgi:hypothetical protein